MFDLNFELVEEFLEDREIEKVALQIPEGLKPDIKKIEEFFFDKKVSTFYIGESCYGACDLADQKAKSIGCDALIHYGHSDMGLETEIPTLFLHADIGKDPLEVIEKALPELEGGTWGLISTIQHVKKLPELQEFLKRKGISTKVGDPGSRSEYPGQILGCDWASAKNIKEGVDGFIYIGTGEFHPIGVQLVTGKPVIFVNPVSENFKILDLDEEEFLSKRYALISNVEEGEDIGILVSTKKGQKRLNLAMNLKSELEEKGFNCYVIVFENIVQESLVNFRLDAYVNTACPRIPFSDQDSFDSPVLTPFEARVVSGEKNWEDYEIDEITKYI